MICYSETAASIDLIGQHVLIVEDEYLLAMDIADTVVQAGGIVLGPVPNVAAALALIETQPIDAAILDVRIGDELSFLIARVLRQKDIRVVFVSGYDDWYLPDDLTEVEVYRKPTDPKNVVRILFPPTSRTSQSHRS